MGLIALEGLQFYSHHGYHKEEQVLGGKYSVDVYMQLDYSQAAANDDLKKTINYEEVYKTVKEEMGVPARLIEHVCQRIIDKLSLQYPHLYYLKVRISKHNPPLKGHVDRVFVTLEKGVPEVSV
ncbi:MAG: dihydroneopterin aldolase [Bacteroidetes bacterium]|nr:dihydroneopterin aldolase [Bacteroidota bacterium]